MDTPLGGLLSVGGRTWDASENRGWGIYAAVTTKNWRGRALAGWPTRVVATIFDTLINFAAFGVSDHERHPLG